MICAVDVPYSPPAFKFHGGGDGRTYSGVWPGGQVARKSLFPPILPPVLGQPKRRLEFRNGF
jgi:hypothetical protein